MDLIRLENVRTDEQREVMERIALDKTCPFCEENLTRYHKRPILVEGKFWLLTENQWPYEGAKTHLLAIARRHVESLNDLETDETTELFEIFKKASSERNLEDGTIAMRFGETASTVKHLHVHLIEPDLNNPEHEGLKFTVSKATRQSKS